MKILYPVLLIILFAVSAILLAVLIKERKQRKHLTHSMELFLQNGTPTEYSTADNSFAVMQNAVCDTQQKLLWEREQNKANAESYLNFTADVSHQLKTPLAALRLQCELKEEENPDKHTKTELALIERMETLVFSLLRLQKLRCDAYEMHFDWFPVSDLLNDVTEEIKGLFPEKQYIVKGSADVRCDRAWFCEALSNIIKNAAEHTAPGGKITSEIWESEQSVQITVQDNGGGVGQEELSKLFHRFYSAPDTSAQKVGIGLAISREIIEKHHGTVTAENGNEGLKIHICLPKIDGSEKLK